MQAAKKAQAGSAAEAAAAAQMFEAYNNKIELKFKYLAVSYIINEIENLV